MRKLFFRATPFFEQERQAIVLRRIVRTFYFMILGVALSTATPLLPFSSLGEGIKVNSFFDFAKNYRSIRHAVFDVASGIDFSVILLKVILALLSAIAVLTVVYLIRTSRLRVLRARLIKYSCLLHADLVRVHAASDDMAKKRAIADRDDSLFRLRALLGQKNMQYIVGEEYVRKFNELVPILLSESVGFEERTAALDYLMFYITHLT